MAKSCALLLVGLMLASLCVANAEHLPDRKLLLVDTVGTLLGEILDIDLFIDLKSLPLTVATGKAKLVDHDKAVALKPGKVSKLSAANVKLQDKIVSLELAILGIDKVVVLDLKKLEPTLKLGKLVAVVVFVLDEVKHVLHLQDKDGNCLIDVDVSVSVFPSGGS